MVRLILKRLFSKRVVDYSIPSMTKNVMMPANVHAPRISDEEMAARIKQWAAERRAKEDATCLCGKPKAGH
jgi:hypothetical protein